MAQFSNDWQNVLLDKATTGDGGSDDPPATRYIGLRHNGIEVSSGGGSGYARLTLTSSTFWAAVVNSFIGATNARVNAASIEFGNPDTAWGYVNELCIYDGISDTSPAALFYLEGDTGETLYIEQDAPLVIYSGQLVLYYYDGAGAG